MKRLLFLPILLGIAGAASAQSIAVQSAALRLTVNIAGFVAISVDTPLITLNVDPKYATSASGTSNFHVASNDNFTVSVGTPVAPTGFTGTAAFSAISNISGGSAGANTQGTLTLSVNGVNFGSNAGTYHNGSVTITVTAL